jgi:hypothetical protein
MYLKHCSVVMRTSLLEQTEKNSARAYGFRLILAHFTELSAGYSPMWDFQLAEWSKEAIAKNQRKLITDGDDVLAKSEKGLLVSPRAHIDLVGRVGITTKERANDAPR